MSFFFGKSFSMSIFSVDAIVAIANEQSGQSYSGAVVADQSGRPGVVYYANWSPISIVMRPFCVRLRC